MGIDTDKAFPPRPAWCTLSEAQVLSAMQSGAQGLDAPEAAERLQRFGPNELQRAGGVSAAGLFVSQFRSFLVYILMGAVGVSALLGEVVDALAIVAILVVNGILGFIQEFRAEKSIEALRRLVTTNARVLRQGQMSQVDSASLVPGDVICLEAGDRISADARLLSVSRFEVDESTLTGESVAVKKHSSRLAQAGILADQVNMVFAGTLCVSGSARAVAVATGMNTEIGHIAGQVGSLEDRQTPLQADLDQLGRFLGLLVMGICALIFIAGIWRDPKAVALLQDAQWTRLIVQTRELFLTSVALAVAAVPEGLAVVVTISLAIGVSRMLKRNALIRRLPSVETLGETNVICTDKTGTLTCNQMTVKKLFVDFEVIDVGGEGYRREGDFSSAGQQIAVSRLDDLLLAGALNNHASVENQTVTGDPTEAALIVAAEKAGLRQAECKAKYRPLDEIAFDSNRKMMSTLQRQGDRMMMITKGAGEQVLSVCDRILIHGQIRPLTEEDRARILEQNSRFGSQALRVLGFARKELADRKQFTESGLIFLGLQAMLDPPRPEVRTAVETCHSAGIEVFMITGDHAQTAAAIGAAIGVQGEVLTGKEIDTLDLASHIGRTRIYARVTAEHKLKIVQALQRQGLVVAMTGDGVNDAPALKKADIGIAMGISGTDVAKEAAEMVLTDDNFISIVNAIHEGRGIYDNIKKFVNYMLSSNFAEVAVLFGAMLIGFKAGGKEVLPLLALHILWLNIVTDSLPAMALGADPIDPYAMQRKPRRQEAKIIDRQMIANIGFVGLLIAAATLAVFGWGLARYGLNTAQTMALTLLILLETARAQMVRRQFNLGLFSNPWLVAALSFTLILQTAAIYLTPLMLFFGFQISNPLRLSPLSVEIWGILLAVTAMVTAISIGFSKTLDRWVPD